MGSCISYHTQSSSLPSCELCCEIIAQKNYLGCSVCGHTFHPKCIHQSVNDNMFLCVYCEEETLKMCRMKPIQLRALPQAKRSARYRNTL